MNGEEVWGPQSLHANLSLLSPSISPALQNTLLCVMLGFLQSDNLWSPAGTGVGSVWLYGTETQTSFISTFLFHPKPHPGRQHSQELSGALTGRLFLLILPF